MGQCGVCKLAEEGCNQLGLIYSCNAGQECNSKGDICGVRLMADLKIVCGMGL